MFLMSRILTSLFFSAKIRKASNADMVLCLQKMDGRGKFEQISGVGRNALDFHIAYYLGVLSSKEPNAYFHVISKDTGFDSLIEYLKTKKVSIRRSSSLEDLP